MLSAGGGRAEFAEPSVVVVSAQVVRRRRRDGVERYSFGLLLRFPSLPLFLGHDFSVAVAPPLGSVIWRFGTIYKLFTFYAAVIRLGIHLRTFLRQEVFAKAVVMEERVLDGKDRVQAVSCQSVDAEVFMRFCFFVHYVWSIPMLLVVTAVLIYNELQLAGLASYIFMLLFIPLQYQLGRIYRRLSGKSLKYTDRRVRLVKEMIHSIKLVKVDALEEYFQENIREARSDELVKKRRVALYDAFNTVRLYVRPPFLFMVLNLFGRA